MACRLQYEFFVRDAGPAAIKNILCMFYSTRVAVVYLLSIFLLD